MAAVRYRIVDVFTDRPLSGNALYVVLDTCPSELMQPIAREMMLSETTFITNRSERAYSMRIFTPSVELPFAGHPTLGTAWLMGPGDWTQTTSGGSVRVRINADGAEMTQPAPAVVQIDDSGVREAAGLDLDERTLHVRVFFQGSGIVEDPGTGSFAGPAAVLARGL